MKTVEAEKRDLPLEEQAYKPAQERLLQGPSHHQDHLVSSVEEDHWRHLNQRLATLGVRLACHFVLEFDPADPDQPRVMKKWVLIEPEQGRHQEVRGNGELFED
jgi:hypothetical protein